ncbi:MAG: type II toxin-antitoxin system PemK/MazF family toxin [Solobacterium sp.]|nr:type II toxin-antitoxin system PemK/MazF family toxin [Solobacterium sp.]
MSFVEDSRDFLNCSDEERTIKYPPEWKDYNRTRRQMYEELMPDYVEQNMRSEATWIMRWKCTSGEQVGVDVHEGDICWLDYGQTFSNEMGYQHFGLVLSIWERKALIVPITSNPRAWEKAGRENYRGHLMRIGQPEGLKKPSTLFLNDIRFINTARILYKRAYISPSSDLFLRIKSRLIEVLMRETATVPAR